MTNLDKHIQSIIDSNHNRRLTIHPELAESLGVINRQETRLWFGIESCPIQTRTSSEERWNHARISYDVVKKLNIPLNCQYEIQRRGDDLHIGPYIGLLVGKSRESTAKYLDHLLDYVHHYADVGGAILAFSLHSTDKTRLTIEGYLFNPVTRQWDKGVFPYPSSIFSITSSASSSWIKHFESVMGNTVFNNFYLNKWSIHKRLVASSYLKTYVPPSIIYKKPSNIFTFLEQYPSIMVKSVDGSKGSNIYQVLRDADRLVITYPKTGATQRIHLHDRDQAYSLFAKLFDDEQFMIQKTVDLATFQKRRVDFRLVIVKNQQRQWEVMGMFARYGKPGNVLSNVSPRVKSADVAFREVFGLRKSGIQSLKEEVFKVAREAVKAIDNTGVHFANTGIDIAVDKNRQIWIIEIQHCSPSHDIALEAGSAGLYYDILKTNMQYAKALTGFPNHT